MCVRSMSDRQLETAYRNMRMASRPLFLELKRRGFRVSVDTYENICIRKRITQSL